MYEKIQITMTRDESQFVEAFMNEYKQLFEDLGKEIKDFQTFILQHTKLF